MKSYREANPNLLQNLCMECAGVLQGKYPHVAWGVRPSVDGSMIEIRPIGINAPGNYCFVEKTSVLQTTTGRNKLLMMMGGELLERYRLNKIGKEIVIDAKQDKRGSLIPDLD